MARNWINIIPWNATLAFWDKIARALILALRSLWLHKLRAMLSVLGIIIGTSAVIGLMAFGEGSMQDALEDIARQGATNIIIQSVKPTEDSNTGKRAWVALYGLTYEDYEKIQMINTVIRHVPMRVFPQEVRHLDRFVGNARVVGTTSLYTEVNKFAMSQGRFLVDDDNTKMSNVCVIGSNLANYLFPFENPLNETIVINNKFEYRIIGVIAERMPTGGGGGAPAEDFNNDVYVPLRTADARFGERVLIRQSGSRSAEQVELHQITITIGDMSQVRESGDAVREILHRNHVKNDWKVIVPLDRLEEAERARDRYTMLLVIIGGISLLVGGIGIMNIMLATVTERTREIGIRRALGAKRRDITVQFIIEAIVQTSIGGMLGVLVGLTVVFGIPLIALIFNSKIPAKLNVPSIFIALIFSILVGVVFGWYPARRASRLDPIEALRHV